MSPPSAGDDDDDEEEDQNNILAKQKLKMMTPWFGSLRKGVELAESANYQSVLNISERTIYPYTSSHYSP